jgi:hypothetical protein
MVPRAVRAAGKMLGKGMPSQVEVL